jgi:hypothetical protein
LSQRRIDVPSWKSRPAANRAAFVASPALRCLSDGLTYHADDQLASLARLLDANLTSSNVKKFHDARTRPAATPFRA